jgi:YebC/PmpR family DNA-binding regulatory protein
MSGHSKWHKVKHQKAVKDPRRAKLFARHIREIEVAARKNSNPSINVELASAIEKARAINLPKDNIQAAIERAAGRAKGQKLESFTYAAFGPQGAALIISGQTDNKNRTLSEIRQALKTAGGTLAELKAVLWQFEKQEQEDGISYRPKTQLKIEKPQRQKIQELITNLETIPEVDAVFTNVS